MDFDVILLPLLVFAAEMCVVTLGTLRIIFVSRGSKFVASLLGFFEILLWLFAIGQIMRNLTNLGCFVGFAAGFTFGNFLGIFIDKQLALGAVVVRAITTRGAVELVTGLKAAGYGVTSLAAEGATGPVNVVFTVIKRKDLPQVVDIIKRFDPRTFYSVSSVQLAEEGVFPARRRRFLSLVPMPMPLRRGSRSAA